MSRSLKILQVAPCYVDFNRTGGGVANIVAEIASGCSDKGHRVELICGNREVGRKKSDAGIVFQGRVKVNVLAQRSHPFLGPTKELANLLGSVDAPDIAHVHTCFSAFTEKTMKVLLRRNIPYIFTPHGKLSEAALSVHPWAKSIWWRLLAKRRIRKAARIAVSAEGETRLFRMLGLSDEYSVVPNGFHLPSEADQPVKPAPVFYEPFVLYFGSISRRKQPELLVRAFAECRARETHRLIIVGPDRDNHSASLRREIAKSSVRDRIIVKDAVYGPEKYEILKRADILCLPSKAEGFPLALVEALGCGVPIVISSSCNFSCAVNQGAGLELTDFRAGNWSAAIDDICLHPEKREQMSGDAVKAASGFRWESIVGQWIDLYEEALQLEK